MLGYVFRRILQLMFVLLGLTIFLFALLKMMPGDPARVMAGDRATSETVAALRVKLGLDKPLHIQYVNFITGLVNGNLKSMSYNGTVLEVISQRLQATAELGLLGILAALIISLPAGLLSAIYRNSALDYTVTTIALFGISIPVFWFALMLMMVFGVWLRILPVSGRGATLWGWSFLTVDGLRHLVIPTMALASVQMAMNARLTRASMLEVMREDYVSTARAKGLKERVVLIKHAFRNALAPVITNIGMQIGGLFAGAMLTETTTAWPGIGRLMYQAITNRDQPVVFGLALFMGTCFMVSYLIVDLLYAYIDPRITYD